MQICWLKSFLEVVKTSSFSEAADRLYITQSAVSKHIKSIETQLGITLFDRKTQNLTPEGRWVMRYARQIVSEYDEMQTGIVQFRKDQDKVIRIAAIPAFSVSQCPTHMNEFQKLHPEVIYRYTETGMEQALEQLRMGAVDFAFVRINLLGNPADYETIPLQDNPVILLCHPTHRLAKKQTVALREIVEEPLVSISTAVPEISLMFQKNGLKLDLNNIAFSSISHSMLNAALQEHSGISLVTEPLAQRIDPEHKLSHVPITEKPIFTLGLATYKKPNSLLCREFKRFIVKKYIHEQQERPQYSSPTRD